uniref:Signal recognition particle subunit SRP68 n=1 Tax=Chenopodium quinoa TaxID=63459 RepID=A0A803NDH6_CHEQI
MAKVNDSASSMDIDIQKSTGSDQPKFSINVLQLLKSAQMQHGLRHGDYTRYRRYCTARLRRLYKSLKFTHGRNKYSRKVITESTVTDVRFLHILLYTTERAWSHAMEKRQLPDGPNGRQRIYLIGRLRKAVKWATLFAQLCALKGDSRTSLEAEAYASYMKGNLLFEQDQNWDMALRNFKSARAVYEELGKYGDLENQVLCRERVEELEPSIRYCLHKIGQSNLQASELKQIGEMEGPALDLFKSKLEAVMAEARSQQAASMTEFNWLGHRFPISNPKTRVSILKAQELEKDIQGPTADSLSAEKKLAVFDKIFSAYHDARSCIRNDLVTAGSAENVKDELNGLDKANLADLSDLVTSGRDSKGEEVAFAEECTLKSAFTWRNPTVWREKRAEAYALYSRALSVTENALQKLQSVENSEQGMMAELKALHQQCRSNICIEHATGILEEQKIPEKLSKKISNMSLTGADKKDKLLAEKLDVYEPAVSDSNTKSTSPD